ncbi:MAG: hypothetical protein CM15mP58_00750 [Burkholderiaceae bacterium]|nr:MAG: hypothetical protein CM15mP58_00750 [Burkholderiaceae bacterium]
MHKDGPKRSAEANYILKGKISIIPELTKLIILSARFCLRNEPEKKSYSGNGSRATWGSNATVAARFGMECTVYMGSTDVERQAQNVYRMKLLGAEVVPLLLGQKLKRCS